VTSHYGDLVLIATDDAALRRALCDELGAHGMRPVVAEDDLAATAARLRPLAVVLDLDRELDDGCVLIARICTQARVPVIALASRPDTELAAYAAGAEAHQLKPLAPRAVLDAIRAITRGTDRLALDRR
jgi:DNA-binding response OmpR family regulator